MGSVDSEERMTSPRSATFDLHDDSDASHYHKPPSPTAKRASVLSNYSKRDSTIFYDDGDDDLDEQMRLLVKQKERVSQTLLEQYVYKSHNSHRLVCTISSSQITARYPLLEAAQLRASVRRIWRSS